MCRVFLVHWNQSEAEERAAALREAGHLVLVHWETGRGPDSAAIRAFDPEVYLVSLDRLPSHGRAVAEWLWEAKKRRGVPLWFCGGRPDRAELARERLPGARFCAGDEVLQVLAGLTAGTERRSDAERTE